MMLAKKFLEQLLKINDVAISLENGEFSLLGKNKKNVCFEHVYEIN